MNKLIFNNTNSQSTSQNWYVKIAILYITKKLWKNQMNELAQSRINFIDQLHQTFLMRKGHGAFAYISISDTLSLFNKYRGSSESADLFISRFVRSF